MDIDTLFYIGSCRYQSIFIHFFSPRLHTTKEILHFLLNYKNINLNDPNIYYIYDGATHPSVINDTKKFINKSFVVFNEIKGLVLEISSRNLYYLNDIPLNEFYYNEKNPNHYLIKTVLSDEEIEKDLLRIKQIIKDSFNIEYLVIISHVNLPLKQNGQFIEKRNLLNQCLQNICNKFNIVFIDPGQTYTKILNQQLYLEDVLPDSYHYENVKYINYIKNQIQNLKKIEEF